MFHYAREQYNNLTPLISDLFLIDGDNDYHHVYNQNKTSQACCKGGGLLQICLKVQFSADLAVILTVQSLVDIDYSSSWK